MNQYHPSLMLCVYIWLHLTTRLLYGVIMLNIASHEHCQSGADHTLLESHPGTQCIQMIAFH